LISERGWRRRCGRRGWKYHSSAPINPIPIETIQVRFSQHGSAPFAGGQGSSRPERVGVGNAKGVRDAVENGGLLGDVQGGKGIAGEGITTVLLTHRCSPEPSSFIVNFEDGSVYVRNVVYKDALLSV
jgi:hypothetical protein